MGRKERVKPERLAEKLRAIRIDRGLTAESLIKALDCPKVTLYRSSIAEFENGKREPPSLILLAYARLAKLPMEILVDDELDLPDGINPKKS